MAMDPSSGVRKQDGASVVSRVAKNTVGRYVAWNWIRSNWSGISSYFDTAISSAVGSMVSSVAADFNTRLDLAELEQFYTLRKAQLGTAKRDVEIAIQSVKANIQFMENNYDEIVGWLEKKLGRHI